MFGVIALRSISGLDSLTAWPEVAVGGSGYDLRLGCDNIPEWVQKVVPNFVLQTIFVRHQDFHN